MPTKLTIVAAIVCFYSAAFTAWSREHNATSELQSRLDAVSQPDLKLTFDELGVGELVAGAVKGTGMFITASLTNRGAPSIADDWSLRVALPDGRSAVSSAVYLPPELPIVFNGDNGARETRAGTDALYMKAMQPIEKGAKLRGVLVFRVPAFAISEVRAKGTKFHLECVDVDGSVISADETWTGSKGVLGWYPGLAPIPKETK